MGSSLGGICSLSLAWEYPKTFGLAGEFVRVVSVEKTNFLSQGIALYRGKRKPVRLYLDSGVVDYTGTMTDANIPDAVAAEIATHRVGRWTDPSALYRTSTRCRTPNWRQAGLPQHKWGEARTSQHNEFLLAPARLAGVDVPFPRRTSGRKSVSPLQEIAPGARTRPGDIVLASSLERLSTVDKVFRRSFRRRAEGLLRSTRTNRSRLSLRRVHSFGMPNSVITELVSRLRRGADPEWQIKSTLPKGTPFDVTQTLGRQLHHPHHGWAVSG
jgi:hypothetical protein